VGVLANKSVRCVAAMLGVLQAGACYVPVDPKAPGPRSSYILENARISLLISETRVLRAVAITAAAPEGIPGLERTLLLDDRSVDGGSVGQPGTWWSDLSFRGASPAPARSHENDPAYILYTSGSTGRPKGVVISHRNALTFVDWARGAYRLAPEDRLSNHAPFHFDLSVFDLYGALASGASVHLVPDRVAPFPAELARWIEQTGITVWYSVPSALVRLLLHGDLGRFRYERLRAVLFAGEAFPVRHLRPVMEAFPTAAFHNLYGPTETNVCTAYPVPRPLPEDLSDLPIGEACANMEAFALTDDERRGEVGDEGELVVRGPCVMLGYWALPERTVQSLLQNPLQNDFRDPIYRTGDRVRVLARDGFQFLGRRDHMVKVRGYRVELGEVEQALTALPGVREAAVVAVEDAEVGARLRAAVVRADGRPDAPAVLRQCRERLPRYAVPDEVVFIDELPRTSTGKTDRVRLAEQLGDRP
jgi:amino acid adenylation domain-containing protein